MGAVRIRPGPFHWRRDFGPGPRSFAGAIRRPSGAAVFQCSAGPLCGVRRRSDFPRRASCPVFRAGADFPGGPLRPGADAASYLCTPAAVSVWRGPRSFPGPDLWRAVGPFPSVSVSPCPRVHYARARRAAFPVRPRSRRALAIPARLHIGPQRPQNGRISAFRRFSVYPAVFLKGREIDPISGPFPGRPFRTPKRV